MNILVCIKQVPDDSVEIHLNAEGTPDLANVTPVVNAFDTYALEMAARLKESSEGEVTVVCVGEDSAKNSLKNCLAGDAKKYARHIGGSFKNLCEIILGIDTIKSQCKF